MKAKTILVKLANETTTTVSIHGQVYAFLTVSEGSEKAANQWIKAKARSFDGKFNSEILMYFVMHHIAKPSLSRAAVGLKSSELQTDLEDY